MANVKLDISQLHAFVKQAATFSKTESRAMYTEALNTMGAEYLRVAKLNTPVGGGKEFDVREKAYNAIGAYEVTAKGYKAAKNRNRGGRTKQLKRIMRGKGGKKYRILTTSEHMRRSWSAGDIVKNSKGYALPVYNTASYASFVNDGHRQQSGRFVPAIGRRLVKSWVPGLHMAEKAEASVKRKAKKIMQTVVNRHLERAFK